jgi:hypothetical protein
MIYVCGRKVKVQTGAKSQTVNICAPSNIHGIYDYVIRLRPPFVGEQALRQRDFGSIEDLVTYLQRDHCGNVERSPAQNSTSPPVASIQADEILADYRAAQTGKLKSTESTPSTELLVAELKSLIGLKDWANNQIMSKSS